MADKKTQSKNKSNHQKRTSQGAPKSSADKERRMAQERAEVDKFKKRQETVNHAKKVAAVAFAVILILAFAIPSAAMLLSGSSSSFDSNYQTYVDQLKQDAEADPSSTSVYLDLGDAYYDWGYKVMTGQENSSHEFKELFGEAVGNYATYLADNDDSQATINQAMAYFYSGDTASAIDVLSKRSAVDTENALIFSRLGFLYYQNCDYDAAIEALNNAIALDPDDEAGAKSEAESTLATVQAVQSNADGAADGSSTSDGAGDAAADGTAGAAS